MSYTTFSSDFASLGEFARGIRNSSITDAKDYPHIEITTVIYTAGVEEHRYPDTDISGTDTRTLFISVLSQIWTDFSGIYGLRTITA